MKKPEKLKIMIIQGDDDNLSLYSDYLSNRGYDVLLDTQKEIIY